MKAVATKYRTIFHIEFHGDVNWHAHFLVANNNQA